ncbi:7TM diverse intracellular signaling domain-containing protein [Pedobacter alpinus]|uniref:histidine kinase n=1 Tax=Pedobacter alpinus TaxID=1590643 RepID=A0ABW5TN63_9SPHI
MMIIFSFLKEQAFKIKISSFKKAILLLSLIYLSSISLFAQNVLNINDALKEKYIGKSVAIFQDSTSNLSFEQVLKSDDLFTPSTFDVPNLGITANNNWLKFTLSNNSNQEKFILNLSNPLINKVSLYVVRDSTTENINTTNYSPIRNRKYKHQFYLFDINLKPNETIICYLKLNAKEQILAPLSIYTPNQVLPVISNADVQTGFYLGIMIVMMLYNLFIYFTIKDKDYLVYCHYIFWVALTQATLLGFSHRYFWTDSVWLAQNMVIICGIMSGIATIIFAKSFLKTKEYSFKLNLLLNITITIYLIALTLLLLNLKQQAFQLVNLTAVTVSLLILYVAWFIYRKKYTPAKYFLISFSVFFISVLIFVAKDYGIVPYNQFTVHAVEIGSALEAILLSFALANKINIFKKEKEISQAEALATAQENERIITQQNIILEQKVNERTSELVEANTELGDTLENLKQTQTQLVEAEKMASLGQLTAGIAHEINNPINFVTSNVAPLERDFKIVFDAFDKMETIALNTSSTAEKEAEIEEFKEELDYDYLKIEIAHLIKGINEGAVRTAEIVKGLRVFSRVDEDDLKKADINEGINSTLVIMNSMLSAHNIKVERNFQDLPSIECYPGKLNQVFLNLISNSIDAIKFNTQNISEGLLTITTAAIDGKIMIAIKDNGTGMSEKTKHKLFEPFYTTKDVGEGTGLGMSIVYNTIKKHNGNIIVNSELNKGTEIIIEIPFYQKDNVSL